MLSSFDEDEDDAESGPSHLMHAAQAAREVEKAGHRVSYPEHDKVRYVLKNLARDWSAEGQRERDQCYSPILTALTELLGPDLEVSVKSGGEIAPPSVLIPGAGLGRLCCEVAGLGMHAQGCEFSYHMLLMSSFILNCMMSKDSFTIHPWLHSNCNQLRDADQLRPVLIPDVAPCDLVSGPGLLSMCAGDFVDVYGEKPGKERQIFDSVVTCFFIDTSHNILHYLETIYGSLRSGGYWINLGPLLYHWADRPAHEDMSIELSLEEVRRCAMQMGFRLIREEDGLPASYIFNSKALYQATYNVSFWVMQKQ
jgi:carnosine N-methyltransferase